MKIRPTEREQQLSGGALAWLRALAKRCPESNAMEVWQFFEPEEADKFLRTTGRRQ